MNRIDVREHLIVDNVHLFEADVNKFQQKMDVSQKLATYMMKKWKLLQKIRDKNEFAREFINVTKQLLRAKEAAKTDDLLSNNIDRLISAWKLVLTTPQAKKTGLRMQDLRMARENCGYDHAAIGRIDDKNPVIYEEDFTFAKHGDFCL